MDKRLFMIAGTLKEIGKVYKPGMVAMIKEDHPRSWVYITGIERKINAAALSNDTLGLTKELRKYFYAWQSVLTHGHFSEQHELFSRKAASFPLKSRKDNQL